MQAWRMRKPTIQDPRLQYPGREVLRSESDSCAEIYKGKASRLHISVREALTATVRWWAEK